MRQFSRVIFTCLVLTGTAAPASEHDDVKATVDKAVQALGGEAKLAGLRAATWKGTCTLHGLGKPITYTGEWAVQPPEQIRVVLRGAFEGKKFERIMVVNGDRGWVKQDGTTDAMDRDRLTEERERLYAAWVDTVAPLTARDFELSLLGTARVGKHAAVGVRVACAGHRDVELYFDKVSGLPVKSAMRLKNPRTRKETTQEVFYEDYKDFGGVKRATRITVKVDHRTTVEGVITDFKPRKKLDESIFARPR
ncbi:MAG TPA: hypothetical protein VG013_34230 [Gemmataceae bacterium]|jgi:hypothetical protein|nr:hypothetical protein [Gemmataceae bacterium]